MRWGGSRSTSFRVRCLSLSCFCFFEARERSCDIEKVESLRGRDYVDDALCDEVLRRESSELASVERACDDHLLVAESAEVGSRVLRVAHIISVGSVPRVDAVSRF